MSDQLISKAKRYLMEGRIVVQYLNEDRASFLVRGTGNSEYMMVFSPGSGWECNCPAQSTCAHILAAKLITNLKPKTSLSDMSLEQFVDSLEYFGNNKEEK